jgi:hypothetical protein
MQPSAVHAIVGEPAWQAGLTVGVLLVAALVVLRWQQPECRTVVVRGGRIARTPARRLFAVVPVLERVREWPADLVELPLQVRATTADGGEVRVLVDLVVWVPPPRACEPYADPLPALECAARHLVVASVRSRSASALAGSGEGLPAALGGACLRDRAGRTVGVVATVAVDEVDLLLSVAGGSGDGRG